MLRRGVFYLPRIDPAASAFIASAPTITGRICRDIWSSQTALARRRKSPGTLRSKGIGKVPLRKKASSHAFLAQGGRKSEKQRGRRSQGAIQSSSGSRPGWFLTRRPGAWVTLAYPRGVELSPISSGKSVLFKKCGAESGAVCENIVVDPNLQRVIAAWDGLSAAIRRAIAVLVETET